MLKYTHCNPGRSLNAAERHALYMRDYVAFYGGGEAATLSGEPSTLLKDSDLSALQRAHRFVRTEQVSRTGEGKVIGCLAPH